MKVDVEQAIRRVGGQTIKIDCVEAILIDSQGNKISVKPDHARLVRMPMRPGYMYQLELDKDE